MYGLEPRGVRGLKVCVCGGVFAKTILCDDTLKLGNLEEK